MANNDQIEAAQRHTYTIRYVDGICFSTDPNSVEAYHGLEWIEVSLLAAKFRNQDQQRFRISVFEKAKWSFQFLRYHSARSKPPSHESKGIYIGE